MADRQASRSPSPSPPPTGAADLGVSSTTRPTRKKSFDYNASNDVLLETMYREKLLLQKQLDDERRLRREAEEIIDQRQDEVYERDAQIRDLRSREKSRERSKERSKERRRRKSSSRESSDSGGRSGERHERSEDKDRNRDRLSPDDAGERRRSGSSTKRKPVASTTTPPPSISPTSPISLPTAVDPGLTKPQAVAAYAALIASVKSFVEFRLAPVFAVKTANLESIVAAVQAATNQADSPKSASPPGVGGGSSSGSGSNAHATYYTMSKPRALLRFMSPRARMFFRLKGADSVHFYAILMEFLRRRVFAELYGGIFKTASGPVSPLPITTSASTTETNVLKEWLLAENTRRSVNKLEARIAEADELAARLGDLLNDVDPAYTGPRVNWGQSTPQDAVVGPGSPSSAAATDGQSGTLPSGSSILVASFTTTSKSSSRPRHHQHSVSDGAGPAVSVPPRPSPLRAEARILRVQLLDRILTSNKQTSFSSPSSRISGLSSYIDTRVLQLSADLARVLLPLQLALSVSKKMGSNTPMEQDGISLPTAAAIHACDVVNTHAVAYASLERAVATEVIRPAVELAVALQLALPEYAVRWVEHPQDSPSLSVCEAFGLDDKRIQFAKSSSNGSGGDEDQYSFVFDISPALYMVDPSGNATTTKTAAEDPANIIYAQGVLLQKGEVATEKTFVHWLHETGIKPKGESSVSNKTKRELYEYFTAKPFESPPVDWRRKTSGERERERERERDNRDDDRRRRPVDGS